MIYFGDFNAAGGGGGDPSFSSTVVLLGFEGADGSTTVTDESAALRGNATMQGNAQVDTAQSKFGSSSLLLDGSGDYITFPDSADWDFGANPFTVEMWIRFAALPSTTYLISNYDNSTNGWRLYYRDGNKLRFHFVNTSIASVNTDALWTPSTNTWYHVAAERNASNLFRIYVDGVVLGSNTNTSTMNNGNQPLSIGNFSFVNTWGVNGWMDEVRITKGAARYNGAFTPPTAAFPRS